MKVRYTVTAARQIEAALDYLSVRSMDAERGLRERILTIVALLQAHPHSGQMTTKEPIRRVPLVSYPYLLDYVEKDGEIVVRRFRHSSRRPVE